MTLAEKIKTHFYLLPSLFMMVLAVMKFFNIASFNSLYYTLEFQDRLVYLGVVELVSAIFFLFRPTMLIGFFLICTYWGGVMSLSIVLCSTNYFPSAILCLFGISLYWREPSLFKIHKKRL